MRGVNLLTRQACIFGSGFDQPGRMEEGSAMAKETFDILIVGPQGQFREIFNHLDEQGSYQLHFAWDYEAARSFLAECTPSAIILTIRVNERNFEGEMEWLEMMKKHSPVLVLSPVEDLQLYKTVMQRGAFDFFTAYTPPDEIDREINNAVTLQTCQVA
jgi:DNA-binding NtrC family response regulator